MIASRRTTFIATLLAATALAGPTAVLAQSGAADADQAVAVEEVIVTARKREERLIDVPIPITAITGAEIERRGFTSLSDIQASVPGLRIIEVGVGGQRIQMRGVSQYLGLPTVGLYVDEVSVNAQYAAGGLGVRMVDMARVEVLRGPQPTLYGEGSMGGTIRYVTASPDLSTFSGNMLAEVSSVADGGIGHRVDGVVNIPLAEDKAGLRLVASHESNGGWIDALGREDANELTSTTLRAKLLVRPIEGLDVSLLLLNERSEQDLLGFTGANRRSTTALMTPARNRYTLGNLVVSYDAGPVTLLSTTGFIERYDNITYDLTAAYAPFYPLFGIPSNTVIGQSAYGPGQTRTQEFRLTSNGAGPVQFALGALYTDVKSSGVNVTFGNPPTILDGVVTSGNRSQSWALFGNLSWDVTDLIQIDLGGRYFSDDRTQTSAAGTQSGTFSTFNPRASIKIKTSDTGIVYADVAKGFRSGGFNRAATAFTPATYAPEKLWTYEIGAKQSLFDRRLLIEAAIYYNQYDDLQAVFPVLNAGGIAVDSAVTNQGKASGPGADLTVQVRPIPGLSITGVVGYNRIRNDVDSANRFEGDPLDMVPEWTRSLLVDWETPIGDDMRLTLHGDYSYTQGAPIILRNYAPTVYSDDRSNLNLRAGLSKGRIEGYVFVNNVTDEASITQPAFGGFPEPIYTKPRTIGLGVKASF